MASSNNEQFQVASAVIGNVHVADSSKADVVCRLYHHLQGLLTLGSDYSDNDRNGDDHDEPPRDEDWLPFTCERTCAS